MVAFNGLVEDCIMNLLDGYYERNAQNGFSKKNRSLLFVLNVYDVKQSYRSMNMKVGTSSLKGE